MQVHSGKSLENERLEPKNHPVEKENHLSNLNFFEFHVTFPGCLHIRPSHGSCGVPQKKNLKNRAKVISVIPDFIKSQQYFLLEKGNVQPAMLDYRSVFHKP